VVTGQDDAARPTAAAAADTIKHEFVCKCNARLLQATAIIYRVRLKTYHDKNSDFLKTVL